MVFFENNRFKYFVSWPFRKHKVKSRASGQTIEANAAQLDRLRQIFLASREIPWPSREDQHVAEQSIYIAFCLTVHGFDEIGQIFMRQDPEVAALTFGTMRA